MKGVVPGGDGNFGARIGRALSGDPAIGPGWLGVMGLFALMPTRGYFR